VIKVILRWPGGKSSAALNLARDDGEDREFATRANRQESAGGMPENRPAGGGAQAGPGRGGPCRRLRRSRRIQLSSPAPRQPNRHIIACGIDEGAGGPLAAFVLAQRRSSKNAFPSSGILSTTHL
jgi:hypothetical protein